MSVTPSNWLAAESTASMKIALLEKAASEKWILLPNHDPAENPFYEAVADAEKAREWELKGHG